MMIIEHFLKPLFLFFLFCWVDPVFVQAQELIPIEVSQHKSVHILFPANVKYCDAAVGEVKFQVTNNIVKLISSTSTLPETNLTVITEDNFLFTFLVLYSKNPRRLNIMANVEKGRLIKTERTVQESNMVAAKPQISAQKNAQSRVIQVPAAPAEAQTLQATASPIDSVFHLMCLKMINQQKTYHYSDMDKNVALEIPNVFEKDNYLFFVMNATNKAEKDFLIDFVNFQQAKRKGIWRRLYREELKKPVYVFNKKTAFNKNKTHYMVFVFEKFKIDKGKKLWVEIGENNGDGFLSLAVHPKAINHAKPLN